ncbi:hypothetical protein EST92_11720 [Streptomyces sp. TM32]|uniref:DUF6197 family protein n=1 Tax=Streptomyces sp. TM32 TaxID=1652669 RepID=UPI001012899F|nr:hypothetical protein [Streptomyces sp. TM32]RXS84219.1 hypothetical protein EST92_11720 [Streptomyces sp. TM32]
MPTITCSPATRAPAPAALSFDERLALAALAVDARINTEPLDLADVIRGPVNTPVAPAPQPYRTPIAALFHRAHIRLLNGGWCASRLRDEQGARCLIGAIRAEAGSRSEADDACVLLLDIIRDEFDPSAETIASWNGRQRDGHMPARILGHAANRADARGI